MFIGFLHLYVIKLYMFLCTAKFTSCNILYQKSYNMFTLKIVLIISDKM